MNQLTAIGVLGKDAVKNTYANAPSVVKLSVAVSDDYKDKKGEWIQRTIWYDCSLFRELDTKRYVKGSKVMIQGTPRLHEYVDGQGVKRVSIQVVVNNVEMIHSKYVEYQQPTASSQPPTMQQPPTQYSETNSVTTSQTSDDDGLPF
jgi:single-strand DNA-binding protein